MSMNFFSVNKNAIALCGRYNIYVYPLSSDMPVSLMQPLDLMRNLPSSSKATAEKLSAVCCDISKDGMQVVAADSGKNVFLFEFHANAWELVSCWEMEKRVVKVQFDKLGHFIIMTDKVGDIYFSYVALRTVTAPKKAVGHTSYILDVILTESNNHIITCDRDEKIRVSKFPASHQIESYYLGHRQAVVNVALVNDDRHLISCSVEGALKMWNMHESKCKRNWNIFQVLKMDRPQDAEVLRMKATAAFGRIFVSLVISGFKELPVLEIHITDRSIRMYGQVKMESDFTDMCWVGEELYVFNPEVEKARKYYVSSHGLVYDDKFCVQGLSTAAARDDWKSFASYNKPFYRLRKFIPVEDIHAITQAQQELLEKLNDLAEHEARLLRQQEEEDEAGSSTTKSMKFDTSALIVAPEANDDDSDEDEPTKLEEPTESEEPIELEESAEPEELTELEESEEPTELEEPKGPELVTVVAPQEERDDDSDDSDQPNI